MPTTSRIRLMSYNIHGCIGRGNRYDHDATMRVIQQSGADIIALQEVYDEQPADRRFLQMLQKSEYEVRYGRTLQHESRGEYGNVLLSLWPISRVELIDISVAGVEPRGAIHARIAHPAKTVDVIATHFGLSAQERLLQARKLAAYAEQIDSGPDEPEANLLVLMGDLNEWRPRGRALRALRSVFGTSPAIRTFPARCPVFALDRILVAPAELMTMRTIPAFPGARTASDHLPLIADITVPRHSPPGQ